MNEATKSLFAHLVLARVVHTGEETRAHEPLGLCRAGSLRTLGSQSLNLKRFQNKQLIQWFDIAHTLLQFFSLLLTLASVRLLA